MAFAATYGPRGGARDDLEDDLVIAGGVERALQLARGSTGRHVREFRDGQWFAPAASRADHNRRLSALLEHGARHVPYYREVLTTSGVWQAPGHVALERFEDVPLLDKTTIRGRFEDLKSDDLNERDWYYNATGGSTGEPMKLVQDRAFTDWERAMRLSIDSFIGRKPGEKRLVIWGSATDLERGRESLRARLGQRLRGEASLNSFRLSPELLPQYVDFMNDYRPQHVIGYVESLEVLARFIQRTGLGVHSPRTITTAAGTLHPHRATSCRKCSGRRSSTTTALVRWCGSPLSAVVTRDCMSRCRTCTWRCFARTARRLARARSDASW